MDVAGAALTNVGRMAGTPLVWSARFYAEKYGRAAVGEVVSKIQPQWRSLLDPHADASGLLGARWYPYAFVADYVQTARAVVRAEEDPFVRELAFAGIDGSMSTVMRAMVRWLGTPQSLAARSQESWRLFHDSGIVTVTSQADRELRRSVTEWQGHNVVVCKIVAEVFTRSFGKTGVKNVRVHREECVAWGRDACVFHVRWD